MSHRPVRAAAKPIGTLFPADWRRSNGWWRVVAMMAKIPERDYEAVWERFQRQARGRLSDNWMREWKVFCDHLTKTVYGDYAKRKAGDLFA